MKTVANRQFRTQLYKKIKLFIPKSPLLRICFLFILSFLILYLRRPSALTHAQFWAEDGRIWYQGAYSSHFSLLTIFKPYAGYLGVFPRLIAELSWFIGLKHTPLFFNIIALIVQTLPVLYLCSNRYHKLVPNKYLRLIIAGLYLCLPYTAEIHATITNSQWFLALLAFMIVFAAQAKSKTIKFIDGSLLLLASLSGPFCIFLILPGGIEYIRDKSSRMVLRQRLVILGAGTVLQALFIIFGGVSRVSGAIGLSITQLLRIIGGQVFGAGLFGYKSLTFFLEKPWIAPVIAIIGIEVLLYVLLKAPKVLRYYIIFSGLIFVAALFSPPGQISGGFTWWQLLSGTVSGGGRYYFLLHLAIVLSLVWLTFTKQNIFLRSFAGLVLILSIVIGFRADFIHQPYVNYNFDGYVQRFDDLKKGQTIDIPINPGKPWQVDLTKD